MYKKFVRPMNELEKAELKGHLFRARKAKGVGLGCLWGIPISVAGAICLWLLAKELRGDELPRLWRAICIVIGTGGSILCAWQAISRTRANKELAQSLQCEMENDSVEVEHVEASAAAIIVATSEHTNEEGRTLVYAFDIGQGQVLLLSSAKMRTVGAADQRWPSTVFELVRTAKRGLAVGIFSYGETLTLVDIGEVDAEVVQEPKDTVIWEGSLDTVETKLLEQFGRGDVRAASTKLRGEEPDK